MVCMNLHVALSASEGSLSPSARLLASKDDLVRVMNKRQEFMWVHERFAGEY